MGRGRRRRNVEMSSQDILSQLDNLNSEIDKRTKELKELRAAKKTLEKNLVIAKEQESEEEKKKEMERLVSLMQEKGVTVEDIVALLS
jgi:phosphotransacetylase